MAESKNRTLKEARKMINSLTGGDELKRLHEKWELERNWDRQIAENRGEQRGVRKGKKSGKIEGLRQAQLQIAKEMLKNKIELEIIIKCTGLKKEEIQKLQ